MKTYALTKDWRIKLYIITLGISIVLYLLLDCFLLSKVSVPEKFEMLVNFVLSLISFSGINALLLGLIGAISKKTNKLNGVYNVQLVSTHNETVTNAKLTIKIGLQKAKVTLKTGTSESESETLYINNEDKDKTVITYTYKNNGNCHEQNTLSMHCGTCLLMFEKGKFASGKYYTDEHRKNYGTIKEIGKNDESNDKKED